MDLLIEIPRNQISEINSRHTINVFATSGFIFLTNKCSYFNIYIYICKLSLNLNFISFGYHIQLYSIIIIFFINFFVNLFFFLNLFL